MNKPDFKMPKNEWPQAFKEGLDLAGTILTINKEQKKTFSLPEPKVQTTQRECMLAMVVVALSQYHREAESNRVYNQMIGQWLLKFISAPSKEIYARTPQAVKRIKKLLSDTPGRSIMQHLDVAQRTIALYADPGYYDKKQKPWELAQRFINGSHMEDEDETETKRKEGTTQNIQEAEPEGDQPTSA